MRDEGIARNIIKLLGGLDGLSLGLSLENIAERKLLEVELDDEKTHVTFRFQDGFARAFAVEGDCCSESWIEHLELPPDLAGSVLVSVSDDLIERKDEDPDHGCLQVYQTRFQTDRGGEIVLEYRNSSNGYYGGYLVDFPLQVQSAPA